MSVRYLERDFSLLTVPLIHISLWLLIDGNKPSSHSVLMMSGRAQNSAAAGKDFPVRHRPTSGVFISSLGPTIVFVTVCTANRRPWLAQPVAHDALQRGWRAAESWLVGRYLLMPDHMHFFCAPRDESVPLARWVTYWKRLFTLETRNKEWEWQSHAWDTRLRRSESYAEKWDYVSNNPVRQKLVDRSEDWPYQGVLNELRW